MTTSAPPDPTPGSRGSLLARFALAFILGIALVAGLGGGALYAYAQQYEGRVLPGVHVGGVNLSGLTADAARAELASRFASLGGGRVVVTTPDGSRTIEYAAIGRRPDVDAMLATALAAGRRGEPVADLLGLPQAALRGVDLEPSVAYDEAKLEAAIGEIGRAVERPAVDATLTKAPDGSFAVTPSRPGRDVDEATVLVRIRSLIARLDAPGEVAVDLPVTVTPPTFDTAAAASVADAARRISDDLVLSAGGKSWTIPGPALAKLVTVGQAAGRPEPIVAEAGVDALLKPIAGALSTTASNASYLLGKDGKVVGTTDGREGRALDLGATRAAVLDALRARAAGTPRPVVDAVVTTTKPALSTADARRTAPLMKRVSKWTTYFPINDHNGYGANIWIPALAINGYVVAPGETFDFWKAVGPVTREKGYRNGGAIINGRTEPQGALAGGICSCSTTLFNAALRGGYKMGDRKNHYYYIDRYPLGLDATVYISSSGSRQTMSWTNDTKYPVLIRGVKSRKGSSGYVTFELYSVPNGRKVTISAPTVRNVRMPRETTEPTRSLPAGTRKRVEFPVAGKDVWRTVTVTEGGKVLRRTTYFSRYSVINGITQVGTG